MAIIERNRVIRTTSRQSTGGYKIECEGIKPEDILRITITHISQPDFFQQYEVTGDKLVGKKSINFKVIQTGNEFRVAWQGDVLPKRILQ